VLAVLDARRGEAFLAAYERRGGALIELAAPAALRPERLGVAIAELQAISPVGVAHEPWLAVGDGACRFGSQLQAAGASVPPEDSPLHLLRAEAICELAQQEDAAASIEQVLPLYGRPPDAELAIGGGRRVEPAAIGDGRR
jgi:tRNA A37 threonylcarbamoyladenosine modification protein TsaB